MENKSAFICRQKQLMFSRRTVLRHTPLRQKTVTTIRVHYDTGYGNNMYLRGSSYPLWWDSGRKMFNVNSNTWVYEIERIPAGQTFEFKPLINDSKWSSGNNYVATGGQTIDIYPNF